MNTYILSFDDHVPEAVKSRASAFFSGDWLLLSSHSLLIRSSHIANPQDIDSQLNLTDTLTTGNGFVIFRLNGFYYGHHLPQTWEWLEQARVSG